MSTKTTEGKFFQSKDTRDFDRQVLLSLDEADVLSMCRVNTTIQDLCNDDSFWKEYGTKQFGLGFLDFHHFHNFDLQKQNKLQVIYSYQQAYWDYKKDLVYERKGIAKYGDKFIDIQNKTQKSAQEVYQLFEDNLIAYNTITNQLEAMVNPQLILFIRRGIKRYILRGKGQRGASLNSMVSESDVESGKYRKYELLVYE